MVLVSFVDYACCVVVIYRHTAIPAACQHLFFIFSKKIFLYIEPFSIENWTSMVLFIKNWTSVVLIIACHCVLGKMEGGRKKIPQKPKNKKNAMELQFLP
jgi:hypothetical protein